MYIHVLIWKHLQLHERLIEIGICQLTRYRHDPIGFRQLFQTHLVCFVYPSPHQPPISHFFKGTQLHHWLAAVVSALSTDDARHTIPGLPAQGDFA